MLFFDPKNHPKYSRGEGGTRDLGQLKFTWKTRSPIFCGHFESVSKKRSWISSDIYAMSIHFLGLPTSTKSFFFQGEHGSTNSAGCPSFLMGSSSRELPKIQMLRSIIYGGSYHHSILEY
jgi:hypothetical protein